MTGTANRQKTGPRTIRVEYDAGAFDQREVGKLRAAADRCRSQGYLVQQLFCAKTHELDFAEIDAAARRLQRFARRVRRRIGIVKAT